MIRHPTPPPPRPSQMSSPPSAQNCRRQKPHNNRTKRCPRQHHHQPHKNTPAQSTSTTSSPQLSSSHSTAPPRTATGLETCHGNGRSTTAHSDGTKSHWGSRPSASTRSPTPPPPGHYRRAATTSSSPSNGMPQSTNGGRHCNSSPRPRRPHTPASIVGTYGGTSGPRPMASHRHHLPHPQRPHTHLAATVGGHPGKPHPRTPRAHAHPPHPTPHTRSRRSTTRHTHPGIMGVGNTHKPTSSRGHQDRPIHPASPDPDPAPQHPTRLHHLVGIPRPRHPHPPIRAPPSRQKHNRPPPSRSSGSHTGRGPGDPGPTTPGQSQSGAPREGRRKAPNTEAAPPPNSSWTRRNTPPRTNGRPTTRVGKDGVYIRVTYIYAYCIARIQYSTRLLGWLPTGARCACRRRANKRCQGLTVQM